MGPQGVIIYAALSGPTGGIWRSLNTGATWQLMMSGQATSVVLAPESGTVLNPATNTYVQGNLQVVYAAIRGVGVYISPNQGQVWNQLLGGIGNPLIFNERLAPYPNVNPTNGTTPNGAQGRITLAVPNSTGNVAFDAVYEGWLYAAGLHPWRYPGRSMGDQRLRAELDPGAHSHRAQPGLREHPGDTRQ